MTRIALVLAAHGSNAEPSVNERIRKIAASLRLTEPFDEVAVAFHQGEPRFAEVLDQLEATDVTVVPVMASSGYYANTVLPRELSKNRRYANLILRQTEPIGCHPGVAALAIQRARALLDTFDLPSDATSLALIGHGSPRHAQSRDSTFGLQNTIRAAGIFREIVCAFLDDEPPVETVLSRCSMPNVLIIPFLIGQGPHAVADIPRRLGLRPAPDASLPLAVRVADRTVVCDTAVGTDPELINLIRELARATRTLPAETA